VNVSIKNINIDLLRHGEVTGKGWSFRGSTDVALSDKGWLQMQEKYDAMPDPFDRIVSSPLQRCALFSQKIHQQSNVPLSIMEGLQEMDFGDWEGVPLQSIEHETELQRFWRNPEGVQPPNGEAFNAFVHRVTHTWEQWLKHDVTQQNGHYLIVAHGGVIRVLLAHILGMPMSQLWAWHMPYASWSRISLRQGFPSRVMFVNR